MRDDRRGSENPFGHRAPRTNGSNGARPEGMRTHSQSLDAYDGAEPVDLMAVQADDELINALSAGMSVTAPGHGGYDADDHVAAILAAWKADVDADPIPELVDLDTAVATVRAASRPASGRARHLAPVAAAAAFIVLAIGGLSVGSYSAQPDDALWAMSKVLYSERAQSVEAAARVETHITAAKQALVEGKPEVAAQELQMAGTDLAVVRPEEGLTELAEVQDFLVAKAAETPTGKPTDPGSPLATQPARPVPPGAAVTSPPSPTPTTEPSTSPSTTRPDPALVDPTVDTTGEPTPSTSTTAPPTTTAEPTSGSGATEGSADTTTPGQSMGETPTGSSGATAAGAGTATSGTTT